MQEEYLENSISLASKIEESFGYLGKKLRHGGVKQAPFMVLHKAYMPRVLVEMGFISNPTEGNTLNSEEGQNEIARAIADAIISYKNEYFGNGEADNSESKPATKVIEKVVKDTATPAKPKGIINSSELKKAETGYNTNGVLYKVQLSTSAKKLALEPRNFKGLHSISMSFDNKLYRYMYGETADYNEAKRQLQEAKGKGFDSAFLIAFKNGEKISIQEALK
jgi:N-acetylmuramoyl-L-alanine amidase